MPPTQHTPSKRKGIRTLPGRISGPFLSVYAQPAVLFAMLVLFLFITFLFIFKTFNKHYMEGALQQNGDNVVMLVEGALYEYMLENDRTGLKNTLDMIQMMPGIEDVNIYDAHNNLAHSSVHSGDSHYHNPNCIDCHENLNEMFPLLEKSFRIHGPESECLMCEQEHNYQVMMIKSPILNEPSCYTADCHAHPENEPLLGSLFIRLPLTEWDASLKNTLFLAGLITLLMVSLFLFYLRWQIKKPLSNMIRATDAVAVGDRNVRLGSSPALLKDLKLLSGSFNRMLDALQASSDELENWSQQLEYKVQKKSEEISEIQNELLRMERIASLGKLSSSVAHEINNPLSGVLTYTKLVHKHLLKMELEKQEKETLLRYLDVVEKETKRCGDIVNGLLDFSREDKAGFKAHHLHRLLKETYTLIDHQMKMESILFQMDFTASDDLIVCNGNQIKQAGIAILMNALEAISENGTIIMKTRNTEEGNILVDIADNGGGIASDDIPRIFEPFYSTKQKASGIGLGLAIVHGIVQNHSGKINVESELGKGTTVSILLPLAKSIESNQKT